MFLMLFVLPENKLSREQLASLQELASGLGAVLARQLTELLEESDAEKVDSPPIAEPNAGEKVIDNSQIVDYLEGCLRQQ